MKKEEDILYVDFQGWPVYKKNVREILLSLGLKEENGSISISSDDPILELYPTTLEDDGMGYGINEKFIEEVDKDGKRINIFIGVKSNEKD